MLRRPGERPVPGQFGVILNNVVCGVRPFVSDTGAIASSPPHLTVLTKQDQSGVVIAKTIPTSPFQAGEKLREAAGYHAAHPRHFRRRCFPFIVA